MRQRRRWVAISAYVLIAIMKKRLHRNHSQHEILRVLNLNMFETKPIPALFKPCFELDQPLIHPTQGSSVIFVPFKAGMPIGDPLDVLTGFLSDDGKANGRPVGVAIDKRGALLVADDVGNVIWRVSALPPTVPSTSPTARP